MDDNTARLRTLTDFTDRHAHGLARQDLRALRDSCRRAKEGAIRTINESQRIRTAKGARRLMAKVDRSYAGTAWARQDHSDRHGTYASWLVPVVDEESIAVCCVSLRMQARSSASLRQWPWLVVPAFVAVLQMRFIRHEERLMEQTFGEAYRAYRARTRRWI